MTIVAWIPLVYVACVLNASLSPALEIGRAAPDWLALTAVAWRLLAPGRWVFLGAAVAGLAHDLSGVNCFGAGMGCYALIGYGLSPLQAKPALRRPWAQVALTAVAVSAMALLLELARGLLGGTPQGASTVVTTSLAVGGYSALVGLPAFLAISWFRESRRQA